MKEFKTKTCLPARQALKIMKITAILLLVGSLHLSARTFSQINLSLKDAPLEKVFSELRKQTSYAFFYDLKEIKSAKAVTIELKNKTLQEALNLCLKDQPVSYTIVGKTVVVKPSPIPKSTDNSLNILHDFFLPPPIDVHGRIVNENGESVIATVTVKGTTNASSTNVNGFFELNNVEENATLVITGVNVETREVKVNGKSDLGSIAITTKTVEGQNIVVNAGYYTVKDKERTGSISRITSKDIEKQPVTNVLATMQGRMAGVNVTQVSGVPGSGFNIEIRGQNSLRLDGNSPLYIIDGVPYSSETMGHSYTNVIVQSSPLNSINPGDIESIEVLKDADATAIYGSRGANGVVLITTKKGKAGVTKFSTYFSRGAGRVTKMMDLMNTQQYLEMRKEAFANDGASYGPADYDVNGTWDQNRYTDWQKTLIGGTADFTDIQTSVSGGTAQTQFLISGNYHQETSVFPGNYPYKKGGTRLNLNHASENQKFKINFSAGYTLQENKQPFNDLSRIATELPPNAPALYKEDGQLNWENGTWDNPLAMVESKYSGKTNDLIANSQMSYSILPGLEVKMSMGFSDTRNEERKTAPHTIYNPSYLLTSESTSSLTVNSGTRQSWIMEPQLTWNKGFGKVKLETLLGSTFQQQTGRQLIQIGTGFSSNSLINNLVAASKVTAAQNFESVYKYQAFFSRVNVSWNERLIFNFTGRRDGSSRFGPDRQFANFGAVGAAWLFSNEQFFKNISFLSFGKLRASYGSSGNDQIGDYQFLDTYSTSAVNYTGVTILQPSRLYNPDFGWETNNKLEVALETGFFHDRLFVTAGWYNNRSSSQLVGIPLPATTGFTSVQANLDATVQNRGVELTIRSINFQKSNFNWTTNFNLSIPRNKLLSFPGLASSTYNNQYVVGYPLNIRRVYRYAGLNAASGIYQFEDINKDGAITSVGDRKLYLSYNPVFFGGLQNQFTYKRWQADFLFQFAKQLSNLQVTYQPGLMRNQPVEVLDRWQKPGDEARFQRYNTFRNVLANQAFSNYDVSNASLVDASFLQLKTLSLSYVISEKWARIKNLRLTLQGQNLFTITSFAGRNVESRLGRERLPPLKVLTAGVSITL